VTIGKFSGTKVSLFFAMPQLVIVLLFFYYPAWIALKYSAHLQKPFGGESVFVGIDNYVALFTSGDLAATLWTSSVFGLTSSLLSIAAALAMAVAVNRLRKFSALAQGLLILPLAIAAPVAGVALLYILHPSLGLGGLVNSLAPGVWQPMTDSSDAMMMTVIAFTWINIPFNFLIFSAGLNSIPKHWLDAAKLDGAGPWRRFVDIQLPLLAPYTFLAMVLGLAESLTQSFGIIHTMTQGGPAAATNILVYKIYSDGFEGLDLSGSATQSVLLIAIVVLLTIIQFRFVERRIRYER
jgi:sn-glycerol 3-phosphate transport system permease protein